MPQQYRLSRADFARMRGFMRIQGAYFSLSYGIIGERGSGAACIVSAKVAPRAVVRNRIKRRARAVLSDYLTGHTEPLVYVLYAKKMAPKALPEELVHDIRTLLAKAGIHGKALSR